MKYQIPEHITWKNLDSGIVLLDLDSSNYYTLNETASLIWRGIMDSKDTNDIFVQLTEEYECDEEKSRGDLSEQISYLLEEGLIEEVNITANK